MDEAGEVRVPVAQHELGCRKFVQSFPAGQRVAVCLDIGSGRRPPIEVSTKVRHQIGMDLADTDCVLLQLACWPFCGHGLLL